MARYSAANVDGAADGRLFAPSFDRNFEPIREALGPYLGPASGTVLEIGCGTGQHVAHLAAAYPRLTWLPSDIDATHRASAAAWVAHVDAANVGVPIHLDAASDWAANPALAGHLPLTAVLSCNVIHISPWAVAEGIVAGAGRVLGPGGWLIFYGPFMEGGRHTGEGNVRFDAGLRAENPEWGVRDIDGISALAEAAGLSGPQITQMPSNNRLVAFSRA